MVIVTQQEIGDELGLGKERVRQLENQGLVTIKQLREAQRHLRRERSITNARFRWKLPREARHWQQT